MRRSVGAFALISCVLAACARETTPDISETLAKLGGTRLVVQVQADASAPGAPPGPEVVDKTLKILDQRLSKQNIPARVMRKEGSSDAIVIDIAPVDDMQSVKASIASSEGLPAPLVFLEESVLRPER
jgi:hypothetical protein